jgi:hypothetical protein
VVALRHGALVFEGLLLVRSRARGRSRSRRRCYLTAAASAASRWHSRFAAEAKGLEAWESRLVLAALEALPHDEEVALAIVDRVARVHGLRAPPSARGQTLKRVQRANSTISSNVIA